MNVRRLTLGLLQTYPRVTVPREPVNLLSGDDWPLAKSGCDMVEIVRCQANVADGGRPAIDVELLFSSHLLQYVDGRWEPRLDAVPRAVIVKVRIAYAADASKNLVYCVREISEVEYWQQVLDD